MAFIRNPDHPDLPMCKSMRTKASYIPDMQDEHYMEVHHPYNQYFCLNTLHNVGPDDDVVCPEDCTPNRVCFEPHLSRVV
ncbi:MAG: hypothetical protein ACE5IR_25820 [bacterium]